MSFVSPTNAIFASVCAPVSRLADLPAVPDNAPEPVMLEYQDLFERAVDHDRAAGLCAGPQWQEMAEVRVIALLSARGFMPPAD